MRCQYCGKIVPEDVKPLYSGHCSWTCLSRHRKEDEAKKREKKDAKYLKKVLAEEQAKKESTAKAQVKKAIAPKIAPKPRKEKTHASILQLNTSGELVRRFESATEAAETLGSAKANIYYACAHGTRHKGFLWDYAKE